MLWTRRRSALDAVLVGIDHVMALFDCTQSVACHCGWTKARLPRIALVRHGRGAAPSEHLRCDDVLRPRSDQRRAHGFRCLEPGVVLGLGREEGGGRRDDQAPLAPRFARAAGAQELGDGFDRRLHGKDVEPDTGEMPARTDQNDPVEEPQAGDAAEAAVGQRPPILQANVSGRNVASLHGRPRTRPGMTIKSALHGLQDLVLGDIGRQRQVPVGIAHEDVFAGLDRIIAGAGAGRLLTGFDCLHRFA
jgi:hypothetical protein